MKVVVFRSLVSRGSEVENLLRSAVACLAMLLPAVADATSYEFDLHLHADRAFEIIDDQGNSVLEAGAGSALLPVVSTTKTQRPSGSQWDFTGTTPLGNLWVLPKTQATDRLFLGIGAEEVDRGDLAGNITFSFIGVSGPGVFSMWNVDEFAQLFPLVTSAPGFGLANAVTISAGGHSHFNYGFTEPGLYDVTFRASATLATSLGGGLVEGGATFTFGVFNTGEVYPDNPTAPYTFFSRTFDNFMYDNAHVDMGIALAPVPEPSTLVMAGLGLGVVAAAGVRRRFSRSSGLS